MCFNKNNHDTKDSSRKNCAIQYSNYVANSCRYWFTEGYSSSDYMVVISKIQSSINSKLKLKM